VHQGKPYSDKPSLFLRQSDFQDQSDNALYVARTGQGWTIYRRENGQEARLSVPDGQAELTFENDWVSLTLNSLNLSVKGMQLVRKFAGELSLVAAAEMYVILRGLVTSLPFLPLEGS
jgi:hypothetical protein